MKLSVRRTLFSIVLLGALLAALHGGVVTAQEPAAPTPACASIVPQVAVPGASAPLLEAGPASPSPTYSGCTACRYNGESCWCNPCPSVCETCPKGGIGGTCFFGTCQTACAV